MSSIGRRSSARRVGTSSSSVHRSRPSLAGGRRSPNFASGPGSQMGGSSSRGRRTWFWGAATGWCWTSRQDGPGRTTPRTCGSTRCSSCSGPVWPRTGWPPSSSTRGSGRPRTLARGHWSTPPAVSRPRPLPPPSCRRAARPPFAPALIATGVHGGRAAPSRPTGSRRGGRGNHLMLPELLPFGPGHMVRR